MSADQTAQEFFDDLKRSNEREAYSLFSEQPSEKVPSDQFVQLMQSLRASGENFRTMKLS